MFQYLAIKKYIIKITSITAFSVLLYACANMATPSGGDYDFNPPVPLKMTPVQNELHVKKNKIEIIFDENVQLDKPLEKIIITPPQKNLPVLRSQNNKVIVELKDTLIANTTYTIDFTNSIEDSNEKNPLENFSLSFSTGDRIDSLSVSGKVLQAHDLEPVSGIYVGVHSNLSDTAFIKDPFLRISRTNEKSEFTIKGMAEGKYKIYALGDLNRDYKYDNPNEMIAFLDTILTPTTSDAVRYDSIFKYNSNKKIMELDSLAEIKYTKFLPNDIILRAFKSDFKRQYLQKHERPQNDILNLYFGAPTTMPTVTALDINSNIKEWSIMERSVGFDSIKYWITDPKIANLDSIRLKVDYQITDTLNQPASKTDTLFFVNRNKKQEEKKKSKKEDKKNIEFLKVSSNINPIFEVYDNINIEFNYPLIDFDKNKIKLENIVDSTYTPINYTLDKDSLNPRKFKISHKWEPGKSYKLAIDSATLHGINGSWNDKIENQFKIKELDQYGNLYINIHSLPKDMPAFVELLDKSDTPVKKGKVAKGGVLFMHLEPGIYYARIILDKNDNGIWDSGNYEKKIAPEIVYYYPKSFDIKANWDIEEDWDITATPIDKQKPLEIMKNKPQTNDSRRKQLEEQEAKDKKKEENQRRSTERINNTSNNRRSK